MAIDDNVSPELFNDTLQPLIDARAVLDNQISAAIQTVMQDFKSRSREGQIEMIGEFAGEALATIFGPNVIAGGLRAAARTEAAVNIIAQTIAFADKTLKAIELLATGTTRARGIPAGNIHKVLKSWNENGHILEIIELIEPGTSHGLAQIPGMSKAVAQTACTEFQLITSLPAELQATGSALIETAKNINAHAAEITGASSAATAGPAQEIRAAVERTVENCYNPDNCFRMSDYVDAPSINVWDMNPRGSVINGRKYTRHALERMAPDTVTVREELAARALQKGYTVGSSDYIKYINPRNIPPSVIEYIIQTVSPVEGKTLTTLDYITSEMKITTNINGDVVTIHRYTKMSTK